MFTPERFNEAGLSDKGHYKNINEDAFKACPEIGLWIVADGMGGHSSGDVASQLAVDYISAAVNEGASLEAAIQQAHIEISSVAHQDNKGMGTTVVAAQIIDGLFEVAWVGDSRAYLFLEQKLIQISKDHSLVQELIDRGEITEGQARIHPQRNVISQVLGGGHHVKRLSVGVAVGELKDGILLLCSDGLSGELRDERIAKILAETQSLEAASEKLIASVLALKGLDNITVLLIQAAEK